MTGTYIDGHEVDGSGPAVTSLDAWTGWPTRHTFASVDESDVDDAARVAFASSDAFRRSAPECRADLLDAIADEIEALGESLIETLLEETALAKPRLEGERARTTGQLRLFASLLRNGSAGDVRMDGVGQGDRTDLRSMRIGVGPVVVFGASNFPLAFSTAGGDSASALAAGCPVIVKAHPAHVGSSTLVAGAISRAVTAIGLPAGVFAHLIGDQAIGIALVTHPYVKAVTFTGSRAGGMALVSAAATRWEPIPVFAEMSSVNPVFMLPGAADEALADDFVASLTLGSGQFCTNPGLVFAPSSPAGEGFVASAARLVAVAVGQTMLTPSIATSFRAAARGMSANASIVTIANGLPGDTPNAPAPVLFETTMASFLANHDDLQREIFGAASLIVRYDDSDDLVTAANRLQGQLTATIHHAPSDVAAVMELLPALERVAGRLVSNGWPTGVEVTHAMTHGGPFPASTDPRFTSVGTRAIDRFLRPLTFQNFADDYVPPDLQSTNPLGLRRSFDGRDPAR